MSSCVHEYICIFTTLCRDTYSYFLPRVSCMEHIICLALNVLCINASVYPAFFIRAKIVCLFFLFCFALSTLKTYEAVIYNVCMLLSFFFLSFFLISFLLVFLSFSFFYFLSFFFLMLVLRIV